MDGLALKFTFLSVRSLNFGLIMNILFIEEINERKDLS